MTYLLGKKDKYDAEDYYTLAALLIELDRTALHSGTADNDMDIIVHGKLSKFGTYLRTITDYLLQNGLLMHDVDANAPIRDTIKKYKTENGQLKADFEEKEADLKVKHDALIKDNMQLKEHNRELQEQLDSVLAENNRLNDSLNTANKKLEKMSSDSDDSKKQDLSNAENAADAKDLKHGDDKVSSLVNGQKDMETIDSTLDDMSDLKDVSDADADSDADAENETHSQNSNSDDLASDSSSDADDLPANGADDLDGAFGDPEDESKVDLNVNLNDTQTAKDSDSNDEEKANENVNDKENDADLDGLGGLDSFDPSNDPNTPML